VRRVCSKGLARQVLSDIGNVSVDGYQGLTVEYARAHGLQVVIRGLRAVSDFEYEFQLATMNRHLLPEVETIFMTPAEQYTFISATFVREVAALGGDVSGLVHPVVVKALQQRYGTAR
jgi:pantetheine-phosphate adenylyltransferase